MPPAPAFQTFLLPLLSFKCVFFGSCKNTFQFILGQFQVITHWTKFFLFFFLLLFFQLILCWWCQLASIGPYLHIIRLLSYKDTAFAPTIGQHIHPSIQLGCLWILNIERTHWHKGRTTSINIFPRDALKSFTSTSDGRMLSDHQQDGSADCVETPQEEHVLLLLTGRVRVMMVHRGDGRSAFQPDLCSHNGETPTISNEEVSCWAGAPAIKWGQSSLWKYLHWHGEHTCKYHNRFFLTLQWWYSGHFRVEQNLKRLSFGWSTTNCYH